ncbi:MAG TPA: YciI family protein, partial [Acidimicrobiia bacterium]
MAYFVVISDQGLAWDESIPMRQQADWAGHAVFMNGLTADGFVLLGGPVGDETRHRARLIVRADSEAEVRKRLAADPWARNGLLTIESIEEWEVLLSP